MFYRHPCVDKGGKTIYIPKFRSMKKNADKLEEMLTPEWLELYYVDHCSILLDIKIVFKTIASVFRRTGAK